jgi:hypothetical protein
MSSPAMQKCLDHIGDAFKPERKANANILLQGCRLKELVDGGRCGFNKACVLLKIKPEDIWSAFRWMQEDNKRLNEKFKTRIHNTPRYHWEVMGWLRKQQIENNNVIYLKRL